MKKLLTFARYGARIDKDIGRALQALRILRNRPDAWIDELRNGTSEPGETEPQQQNCTNELSRARPNPTLPQPHDEKCTNEFPARTARTRARLSRTGAGCAAQSPSAPASGGPVPQPARRLSRALRHKCPAHSRRPRWNARARGP